MLKLQLSTELPSLFLQVLLFLLSELLLTQLVHEGRLTLLRLRLWCDPGLASRWLELRRLCFRCRERLRDFRASGDIECERDRHDRDLFLPVRRETALRHLYRFGLTSELSRLRVERFLQLEELELTCERRAPDLPLLERLLS